MFAPTGAVFSFILARRVSVVNAVTVRVGASNLSRSGGRSNGLWLLPSGLVSRQNRRPDDRLFSTCGDFTIVCVHRFSRIGRTSPSLANAADEGAFFADDPSMFGAVKGKGNRAGGVGVLYLDGRAVVRGLSRSGCFFRGFSGGVRNTPVARAPPTRTHSKFCVVV